MTPEPITPEHMTPERRKTFERYGYSGASDQEIRDALHATSAEMIEAETDIATARAQRRIKLKSTMTVAAIDGDVQALRAALAEEIRPTPREIPNFDQFPATGYPPGDPRSQYILITQETTRAYVAHFLRVARAHEQLCPTATIATLCAAIESAYATGPSEAELPQTLIDAMTHIALTRANLPKKE